MQVHNDLKTKNILLSDSFGVAKIGAHMDLSLPFGCQRLLLQPPTIFSRVPSLLLTCKNPCRVTIGPFEEVLRGCVHAHAQGMSG